MPEELIVRYLNLPVFAMVASRLGGMIMFQPVLGSLAIPTNVRAILVIGLSVLMTPFVELNTQAPATLAGMVSALVGELLVGVLIGTAIWICFLGLQLGGQLIAQESGLAFGQIADPASGVQQTVLSSFYVNLCVLVYLIVGGHRAVMRACLDTFDAIPLLGDTSIVAGGGALLLNALTLGGEVAIRVAAPTVITLFMANLAMGFISRTVPQLNIATIGFSLKALVGFAIMAISLPVAVEVFSDSLAEVIGWFEEWAWSGG